MQVKWVLMCLKQYKQYVLVLPHQLLLVLWDQELSKAIMILVSMSNIILRTCKLHLNKQQELICVYQIWQWSSSSMWPLKLKVEAGWELKP